MDSLTRKEIKFSERVQEIRSTLTSSFETEFGNLVYRIEPEPEEHLSLIIQIFSNLHQQESQLYMVHRERVPRELLRPL